MSRKFLLARGVLLGYGALVTQIFYSIASIPLALAYLSKEEFGLWSLITTLVTYLQLMEFGMTNAFNRHLFECKDHKEDGRYGRLFLACFVSIGIAALLVLVIGVILTYAALPLFKIPVPLREDFTLLMLGSVVITSASLATRVLVTPLYIHQRHDLIQLSQIGTYVVLYGVLFFGFHAGWGLYSMLANFAGGFIWGFSYSVIACIWLKLYPRWGTIKLPDRAEWKSVLHYSVELFAVQIGTQLANSMPMLLIPRLLGLEAAAIWTVCTRPFNILRQVVGKPYEYSLPMLCEMFVKGDLERMRTRWCHVTQLVTALAVCIFTVGAANNHDFIRLWVGDKMAWHPSSDWLMGALFLVSLLVTSVFGVVGFEKKIGMIRYAPFAEAILVAVNAWWMTRLWGIPGLVIAAILGQVLIRLVFGARYLAEISGGRASWFVTHSFLRPLCVLPLCALAAWGCSHLHGLLPGYEGLLLSASTGTLTSGALVIFLGVSSDVRSEMTRMFLKPLARFLPRRFASAGS